MKSYQSEKHCQLKIGNICMISINDCDFTTEIGHFDEKICIIIDIYKDENDNVNRCFVDGEIMIFYDDELNAC